MNSFVPHVMGRSKRDRTHISMTGAALIATCRSSIPPIRVLGVPTGESAGEGMKGCSLRLLTLHKSRKDRRLVHYLAKLLVPMMNMIAPDLFIPVPASEEAVVNRDMIRWCCSPGIEPANGIPSRPVLIQERGRSSFSRGT